MSRLPHAPSVATHTKLLLGCLLVLALVSACSGSAEVAEPGGSEEGGAETAAAATAAPAGSEAAAEGESSPAGVQELVVGVAADPWVDAEGDRKRRPNYPLNADVCETLVRLGTDFNVEPSLAEVEFVGDNTFRFTLRDDVAFSDGRPVTAEDVKYSIDYTTEEPSIGFSFLSGTSTTVIDEQTVEITPDEPNLRLPEQINHPTYAVLTPGDDPLNDIDVTCTGPFMVDSYEAEQQLVVVRNDDYWGEPALLDQITFRFYADDTTRALALQNGEVDMITDVPLGILSSLEDLPGIRIERAPVGNVTMFYIARRTAEGEDRLLADPLVRRAVAHAIDRQSYVDGVLAGNAEIVSTIAPPAVLGEFADMVEGIPYDPEEAGRLLDEAGWVLEDGEEVRTRNGEPLTLEMVYARIDATTVEFVQSNLRAVGFDAQILQLDPGAYTERLDAGTYDIDLSQPNQNDANPAFLLALRWYSKASGANAQIISPGVDTEFEAMIDEILVEDDPTELQRRAAEAMHELVDVEVGGVPLAGGYRVFAMREEVQGLVPHPSGTNQRWSTVFIAE